MLASDSYLMFGGDMLFLNNNGSSGGAINLLGDSVMFLKPYLQMDFTGNVAVQKGGAIYVSGEFLIDSECFFQVIDPAILPTNQLNISLTFENNSALEAGDALYGGVIERCFVVTLSGFLFHDRRVIGGEIFNEIAVIRQEYHTSIISSNPEKVCFCIDGAPDCDLLSYELASFPGQSFQLPLVAVGQRQGAVPAVVRSSIFQSTTAKFGQLQELQETERHCRNLTYTVNSNMELEIILLIPDGAIPVSLPS